VIEEVPKLKLVKVATPIPSKPRPLFQSTNNKTQ